MKIIFIAHFFWLLDNEIQIKEWIIQYEHSSLIETKETEAHSLWLIQISLFCCLNKHISYNI